VGTPISEAFEQISYINLIYSKATNLIQIPLISTLHFVRTGAEAIQPSTDLEQL
jgi:hypothetical protein